MEDLSMFQRPRTVALELMEVVDLPTRPIGRVWLRGLHAKHLYLGISGNPDIILLRYLGRSARQSCAVAGELNMRAGFGCSKFVNMIVGLIQVEYSSDSGSDGYYSCKEETIPCKDHEWQQRNLPEELFKILARERSEIREVQKKTEVQLGLLINLATLIVETLTNSSVSRQEDEVLAVTLRSGKQLERPPLTTHHIPPETSKKVDIKHGERNTQDTQKL
ncbi:hypothetical protein PIB30_052187 [Stylosanthes scabra]|uniref:Uncharacterized protein n=1 Tax=Stylosanthes scabra TaxID=79078 RepID=A0ABU6UK49_9FABA|nr:hypothetical protein [Stylosanthes scabra]